MSISLEDRAPLSARALSARLAERGVVWAWLDVSTEPWLRVGDVLGIASEGSGIPVVDDLGRAMPRPSAGGARLGVVREIIRDGRRIRLDRLLWRAVLASQNETMIA